MNYPLISEYIEAIKAAEDNFEELSYLRPVLGDDGMPVMTSGNFAVVFKMQDVETGKFYALKCFTKEQEGRAEAYHQIAEELKDVDSPYLTSVRYLDKELFVDTDQTSETEFPVLLMDWVEGKTLDKYLRVNLDDKYTLEMLAYRFSLLAQWLIPQPFAHGDLKPDNILVREDGSLVLVDYDGMYIPTMKGQKARELGSPNYRHPKRTKDIFDNRIDDFAIIYILLSLKVFAIQPLFVAICSIPESLLFTEEDSTNIFECKMIENIKPLLREKEIATLFSLYLLSLAQRDFSIVPYELLSLPCPSKEVLSTKILEREFKGKGTVIDQNGILYSRDGKRLVTCLWNSNHISSYRIKEGVLVICDNAFSDFYDIWDEYYYDRYVEKRIDEIVIPNSVVEIGVNPFSGTVSKVICNSPYYEVSNDILFEKKNGTNKLVQCFNRHNKQNKQVDLPEGVTTIGERAFYGCDIDRIVIPRSVIMIDANPFISFSEKEKPLEIISLSEIFRVFNDTLYDIRSKTLISFFGKSTSLVVEEGMKTIGKYSLSDRLNIISLPRTLEKIESFPSPLFMRIIYLPIGTKKRFERLLPSYTKYMIEQDVSELLHTEVDEKDLVCAWEYEYGAKYSVDKKRLLRFPISTDSYIVKDGTKVICDNARQFFCSLKQISLPDSIIQIGENAFGNIVDDIINKDKDILQILIPRGTKNKFAKLFSYTNVLSYNIIET